MTDGLARANLPPVTQFAPAPKSPDRLPHVVIVGSGFGGLTVAKGLAGDSRARVTLIDQRNHHLFQPLLYQVATAGLSPADIAAPIRAILAGAENIDSVLARVDGIDLKNHQIRAGDLRWNYDFLVMACGARHSYFGNPSWEEHAPGLKTLEQATEIRRRVLLAFELAEREADPLLSRRWMTFIVVGGGPTGVELAGAIAEIARYTLEKDFRRIDPTRTQVILVEGGPRILGSFNEKLSRRAARDLETLGVQILTSTRVTEINERGAAIGSEFLEAGTVIWAAGVKPSSTGEMLGCELDPAGRVKVAADLTIAGYPEVFVLGDQAHARDETGAPLPGLAPVAMQQGRYVARILRAELRAKRAFARNDAERGSSSKLRPPFRYVDKGQMATIGRKRAVVQFGRLRFGGFLAWLAWLTIHIFYLIGFKNRFFVLWQWTWSYLTFQRGARLIVDKEWRVTPRKDAP